MQAYIAFTSTSTSSLRHDDVDGFGCEQSAVAGRPDTGQGQGAAWVRRW